MFDFIRTHRRLMQFVLLLLILPSFAFFGLEGYTRYNEDANVVAKVAGQSITQQELDAAQRQQGERLRQMFGDQFDPRMLDTPEAKQNILDELIAQRALAAEAAKNNLSVSDQALQRTILDIPGLKKPDGQFDTERYKSLLSAQGMTPAMFEARLRRDLALQQVNSAIQNTAFAPKSLAARLSEINEQEREIQEMTFKAAAFVPQVKVTDEMLKAYYDKNASQFQIPERATAEYVVLDNQALASQLVVSDEDVKSYYEQNVKRFTVEEQRRASHILIAADKDAPAEKKSAAKAKAEQLLAQLRKNPGDFAKLATENSQDPGSAERGGDLDFFGRGMMVKPFEDVAYTLKQGEISNVVESDFGYHIIKVTDIKGGSVKTLDDVKAEITAEIKKQQGAKKYAELAEVFSNMVYEQPDSLKPVADKLGLKIQTSPELTRGQDPANADVGKAPYNHPKFLSALFSDETIKKKNNTEAIEIAPNTLIAGRIAEHKPASKKPFEEVKPLVRERVVQTEAIELARKAGEAKLAELKVKPESATSLSDKKIVSRAKNAGLPNQAFLSVMKADVASLPAYVGAELPGEGYGIYRINKVMQPGAGDSAKRLAEQQQIAGALAQQEMFAYMEVLKEKAKAEIIKAAPSNRPSEEVN